MKKVLVVLVILGVGGYVAYAKLFKPERRACQKLAELCGDTQKDADRCESDIGELRKALGDDGVRKLDACVAEAKTCAEGTGCLVGAGASAVGDAFKQFLQGVGNALKK